MNPPTPSSPTVAILGGGITGLAAAHRLHELLPSARVTLFEASGRLGGVLRSERRDGFLVEHSADNFITNVPWGVDLCRRLGMADELLRTNPTHRQAYVVCRGRLREIPEGFLLMAPSKVWPVVKSPVLSWRGKLRLAWERFVAPRRERGDESLGSFVRRRLGRETFERLVQPLVSGIYTADPERLSMQAALPRFLDMERDHGSLTRAARAERRRQPSGAASDSSSGGGARYSLFVTPQDGMESLVTAVAGRLPAGAIRLNAPIRSVERTAAESWRLVGAGAKSDEEFHAVIIAAPAHAAAEMLTALDAPLAADLAAIPYAGAAIVLAGYRREQIGDRLAGFGFVVPEIEHRRILACSYSSVKYAGRAPDGMVLLRVFIGGATHPEWIEETDDELRRRVAAELADLLRVRGEPVFQQLVRWRRAMPQYHVGHTEVVRRIDERVTQHRGLALAGNAYRGVGVPQCIHSGETAAESVARLLTSGLDGGEYIPSQ